MIYCTWSRSGIGVKVKLNVINAMSMRGAEPSTFYLSQPLFIHLEFWHWGRLTESRGPGKNCVRNYGSFTPRWINSALVHENVRVGKIRLDRMETLGWATLDLDHIRFYRVCLVHLHDSILDAKPETLSPYRIPNDLELCFSSLLNHRLSPNRSRIHSCTIISQRIPQLRLSMVINWIETLPLLHFVKLENINYLGM